MDIESILAKGALKALLDEKAKSEPVPATAEASNGFVHIQNLQVGEMLEYMGGALKFPKKGERVCVYKVFEAESVLQKDGERIHRYDFSVLIEAKDWECLLEYPMDSRYFKRVDG